MGDTIDLNADLGEGFGVWSYTDDEALLDVITSANVACGFHAGDPSTMRRVCRLAAERGVRVGAQVAYRDLAGFGRREMDYAAAELAADVLVQLGGLEACARDAGTEVSYVKAHGALYHRTGRDPVQAGAVVEAVGAFAAGVGRSLPVLGPPGSVLLDLVEEAGLRAVVEGFADRAYRADGRLVPRGEPGAVVAEKDAVAARAVRMVTCGEVEAVDGSVVRVSPGSLCLHGDTPDASRLAHKVRAALESAGVRVEAFG